jgi:hypothetical protein
VDLPPSVVGVVSLRVPRVHVPNGPFLRLPVRGQSDVLRVAQRTWMSGAWSTKRRDGGEGRKG